MNGCILTEALISRRISGFLDSLVCLFQAGQQEVYWALPYSTRVHIMGIRHRRLIITRGLAVDRDLDILINSCQGELFINASLFQTCMKEREATEVYNENQDGQEPSWAEEAENEDEAH